MLVENRTAKKNAHDRFIAQAFPTFVVCRLVFDKIIALNKIQADSYLL